MQTELKGGPGRGQRGKPASLTGYGLTKTGRGPGGGQRDAQNTQSEKARALSSGKGLLTCAPWIRCLLQISPGPGFKEQSQKLKCMPWPSKPPSGPLG